MTGQATTGQQVRLPQLGESVDSGVIVAWLVEVGDDIEVEQPIAEISTDKVDTEIPSPVAGRVTRLLVDVDDEVAVGEAILEVDGDDSPDGTAPPVAGPDASAEDDHRSGADADTPAAAPPRQRASAEEPAENDRLSPKVKRLLDQHGLDPSAVTGTGPDGRITPEDVRAASGDPAPMAVGRLSPKVKRLLRDHDLDPTSITGTGPEGRITPADVHAAGAQPARSTATRDTPGSPAAGAGTVEPLSRTRRVIAEVMLESMQTTAQLTSAIEADVTGVMHVRARTKQAAVERFGFAPSPLAFIVKATCRALQRHPVINASIDTDAGTVTYHRPINLGMAVDTEHGLMVPVIRDAHELGVLALQGRINGLAARARSRQLQPDDMTGGTFTVTNTGSGGTLFDTPILNPPEAAILATPRIERRPVVIDDASGNEAIAIRHRTYLCLSYDHRLIDGADAARFLTDLAAQLEETDWEQEVRELT